MDTFDTIQGKLFYTVYLMHQQNEIDAKQKANLKDLIIQKHPSLSRIQTENVHKARSSLLDLANSKEVRKEEKGIKPIQTNFKYRSTRSLIGSPSRI